jgi:hypothetical protein
VEAGSNSRLFFVGMAWQPDHDCAPRICGPQLFPKKIQNLFVVNPTSRRFITSVFSAFPSH